MAIMEHRTTFALDEGSIARLKRLASAWKVSQAEVVRRALEQAERNAVAARTGPLERLRAYHAAGGLAPETAKEYLEEVAEGRAAWGRDE